MKCVERGISSETVRCLSELLEQAQRGDLVGVAVGAIYRRNNFDTRLSGEANRNPLFAMGVVALMQGELTAGAQAVQRRR